MTRKTSGSFSVRCWHCSCIVPCTKKNSWRAQFPDQWADYAAKVPHFFPRRLPTKPFKNWDFKQWVKNREYQAVIAVFLGLIALQIWQMME